MFPLIEITLSNNTVQSNVDNKTLCEIKLVKYVLHIQLTGQSRLLC